MDAWFEGISTESGVDFEGSICIIFIVCNLLGRMPSGLFGSLIEFCSGSLDGAGDRLGMEGELQRLLGTGVRLTAGEREGRDGVVMLL